MTIDNDTALPPFHRHVFLGEGHEQSERKTWTVIWLCGAMMCAEIIGGVIFGSIALVADGLHMSTHAGALLLAALAYTYARRHAENANFTFGTGKFGDLAGFTSAIVLAMIALLIGYESVTRMLAPVPIHFSEAIPIACLGLAVNLASAWLLSSGHHHGHSHGHHGHSHGQGGEDHGLEETHVVATPAGDVVLGVYEDGVPPRFRLRAARGPAVLPDIALVTTVRPDGTRQDFALTRRGDFLESAATIPEPHAFTAHMKIGADTFTTVFEEHHHAHGATGRDNNMRAAVIHVVADAAVSVLVIVGLLLARTFGWLWMDPLAGIFGACVIASWSYGLIRDTGAILLDRVPDRRLAEDLRTAIESDGSTLADLHLWRLGPGHLGAIVSVCPKDGGTADDYRARLAHFRTLSHLTIEIHPTPRARA
ncbi:MAG: CDF family Co(II)/Ni(II) efflux transporter DmeF [Pseudomonadota bacterium]|nr:CDF family Co(II)/Ni(II) efflux transporter DmeF [Pseudomonadota bacterium]